MVSFLLKRPFLTEMLRAGRRPTRILLIVGRRGVSLPRSFGTGEGEVTVVAKVMPVNARSRRFEVLRCLHFLDMSRLEE